ncbi:sugar ABC transporter permease [Caldiplasma sukawensis]
MVDQAINNNENLMKKNSNIDLYRRNLYYKRMKKIKLAVSHIVLIIFSIFAVFPIYYIVLTSLNPIGNLINTSLYQLIPNLRMNLSNYSSILFQHPFLLWLRNTLYVTILSTLIGVALSISAGIAFSRFRFPLKVTLLYMLLILSLFPFTMMVIPYYFMFSSLHLTNSLNGLLIPYSAGAIVYSSYLIKNYVDAIPKEYEEAAQMDGMSKVKSLFRVLIPMSKPVIIFALLIAFMGPYTDYALAGQFLTSKSKYTMAIGMYYVSQGNITVNYGVYAAFSVLMGIPIFILFFVFQKYLVSGFSLATYK